MEALVQGSLGLALLAAEGFSTGLGLGFLTLGQAQMARYVGVVAGPVRDLLLLGAASLAAIATLMGGLVWMRRGAIAVRHRSLRLAPALLAAMVPPLFAWPAWEGRDLQFLVLAAAVVLGVRGLVRVSQSAPPLVTGARVWPEAWARAGGAFLRGVARSCRPGLLVGLGALAYAAYFGYVTVVSHRNGFSRSFDLGLESNALWNVVHGGPFLKSSPFSGPEGSLVGYHAIFLAYLLAPFFALHQDPETLLAIQAALIGGAALPLFFWSRRFLGEAAAALVSFCYLLYPASQGANLYDFHYLAIAPFFLWLTLWALEVRRDRVAGAGVLLCLALREDVAASLTILGLYLFVTGRRPLAGLLVSALSAGYFVAVKFFVMPMAQSDPAFLYAWAGLLAPGEASFSGVLKTILGNPAYALGTVLTLPKLVYVLQILVPLAFLPLRRPIGMLFLLPGLFFTLLSTGYLPFTQISFQYTAHWTGFMFPALVLALCRAERPPCPVALPPMAFRAALAALAAGSVICSYQYGAVFQRNTARGGFERFRFGTTDLDRARRLERARLIAMVPERAKIAASETVVPHVSCRPDAYTLRLGVYDAEYLLFSLVPAAAGEPEQARAALESGRFGVLAAGQHFVLARRGQDPAGNAAVVEYLSHLVPLERR
jgi:uncharacterized membrane protein